jgi:hypothetical protein
VKPNTKEFLFNNLITSQNTDGDERRESGKFNGVGSKVTTSFIVKKSKQAPAKIDENSSNRLSFMLANKYKYQDKLQQMMEANQIVKSHNNTF